MTKYEIKTDHFEFDFGAAKNSIPCMTADEVFGTYENESANDPKTEATFDTLEEARAEFAAHYANYGSIRAERGNVFWCLVGNVAWIEENEYDEDGDFDQSCGTYDISAEPYGIFNSYGVGFTPDEWDNIIEVMNDDLREELSNKLSPCSEQDFFTAYAYAHADRFGEEWELDKPSPNW